MSPVAHALLRGALAGVVSGAAYTVAFCGAAILIGDPWDAPLRVIGAVALGESVLRAETQRHPTVLVLFWAALLHLLFVSATGALFAWIVHRGVAMRRTGGAVAVAGLLYALVWWLVGVYVIAPLLGWNWFPAYMGRLPLPLELAVQVVAWGGVLGLSLALLNRAAGSGGAGRPTAARR